jgi:hypothetical protein
MIALNIAQETLAAGVFAVQIEQSCIHSLVSRITYLVG